MGQSKAPAVAYTDMYDQVYWTKHLVLAAPIGNRGNRVLGCTYYGLTFVRPKDGPVLAYHVSWHKPASPLQDGLEALYAEPRRAAWLGQHIRLHIWDRGGCGRPTLRWALHHRIPYLTVSRGATSWRRFRGTPQTHTRSRVPVFVRRDARVARGAPKGAQPKQVIFPAHPRKGRAAGRALRYQTAVDLPKGELRDLDRLYKTRWPANENPIKALVAIGFDRNLDRGLTPTTSRGTDAARTRRPASPIGRSLNAEAEDQLALLLGRLGLYGDHASRLHEEVLLAAAPWSAPVVRKGKLRALGLDHHEAILRQLDDAPALGRVPHEGVRKDLASSAERDLDELLPSLRQRADAAGKRAEEELGKRASREGAEMRKILEAQEARIKKHLERPQLELKFNELEKRQQAAERSFWGARLDTIGGELVSEPKRIDRAYQVRARRLDPLGLVYLWPRTG